MGVRMELAEACVIEDDVMIVLAAERGMPAGHGRPGCRGRKRQDSAATVSQKVNKPRSTRVAEGSRKGLPDSLSLCLSASALLKFAFKWPPTLPPSHPLDLPFPRAPRGSLGRRDGREFHRQN